MPEKQLVPEAIKKLKAELEKKTASAYDKLIIRYLIQRCKEDKGLIQDVEQKHKTYAKCYDFIKEKARKEAKNGMAAIEDSVVYEWAEDYYHKDDKAEEEEKARKEKERIEKNKKKGKEVKKKIEERKEKVVKEKKDVPKKTASEEAGAKRDKKGEIDGQMSLFDLM